MSIRLNSFVLAAAVLLIASLGVFIVPRFGVIFADMMPGEPLPWMTRVVISAAPGGFVALAIFGAVFLVCAHSFRRAHWVHAASIVVLALAVAFTTVALFWPVLRLLEQAA